MSSGQYPVMTTILNVRYNDELQFNDESIRSGIERVTIGISSKWAIRKKNPSGKFMKRRGKNLMKSTHNLEKWIFASWHKLVLFFECLCCCCEKEIPILKAENDALHECPVVYYLTRCCCIPPSRLLPSKMLAAWVNADRNYCAFLKTTTQPIGDP